jgi:hypothetical protein
MKLNRRNEPKVYRDLRPLSQARIVRGEDRETWRLWMLIISFGGIIVASIVTAAVGS